MVAKTESARLKELNYAPGASIEDMLDVFTYDESANYFHTVDGRFARMWHIGAIPQDVLTEADRFAVSNAFATVLNQFPEESDGQILRITHRDIRGYLDRFADGAEEDGFGRDLIDSIISRQLEAVNSGFFGQVSNEMVDQAKDDILQEVADPTRKAALHKTIERTFTQGQFPLVSDLYLVFMWTPEFANQRMVNSFTRRLLGAFGMGNPEAAYSKAYGKARTQFLKHASLIEQALIGRRFQTSIVTGQGLIEVLYRELNPVRAYYVDAPRYTPTRTVRECLKLSPRQVGRDRVSGHVGFTTIEPRPDGWKVDNTYFHAVSAKLPPEGTWPGMLSAAMDAVEGEGWSAINFHVANQSVFRNTRLKLKQMSLRSQVETFAHIHFLQPDPEMIERKENDLSYVSAATHPENITNREMVVDASIHVVVKDQNQARAKQRAEELERHIWDKGYFEQVRGEAVIHHTLPMNYRYAAAQMLQRDLPYLTSNIADFAPLFCGYQGVNSPAVLVNNRNGAPCFIDIYDEKTTIAGHSLVVGSTGSGKSFMFNSLLMAMTGKQSPKTFILDKGRSYESLCQSRGGTYIDMVTEESDGIKPTCLNPFFIPRGRDGKDRMPTEGEREFIRNILVAMVKSGGSDTKIDKPEYNLLLEAINKLYANRKPGKEVTLSDFVKVLKSFRQSAGADGEVLARKMFEFTREGVYGRLFDGKLAVDWDADLIVFETERMADSPAMPVALMILFFQLEQYVKVIKPLDRHAIFAIDEAWKVLTANAEAAKSVDGFFREFRKYKGACFLISQSVNDFVSLIKTGGTGIINNTKHYFFLSCSSHDYKLAQEYLDFSESEIDAWRSVSSLPPFYSEVFYRQNTVQNVPYSGIFRLYSNPIALWTATSSPKDRAIRREYTERFIKQGIDANEARRRAIKQLAEEYPYGSAYQNKAA